MLEVEDDDVGRAKKRYFAMVTQLGKHAGYDSRSDRELFKQQIKEQLGNESISDMKEYEQIRVKIEELHLLASHHYNYIFPNHDPGILSFDNT